MQKLIQVLGSPTFGVVLSLLLIFQWHKQHAKDQAVKNSLFAMRRKVCRNINDSNFSQQKSYDLIDDIDSVLATLGYRKPFQKQLNGILCLIGLRHDVEDNDSLTELNPERYEAKFIDEKPRQIRNNKKSEIEK